MTPDELDAIRERHKKAKAEWAKPVRLNASSPLSEIYQQGVVSASAHDVPTLLAYAEELERERARSVARYADTVIYGRDAASRFARLRAIITELSHHGDMTPTGKRALMNVLDGVE